MGRFVVALSLPNLQAKTIWVAQNAEKLVEMVGPEGLEVIDKLLNH
jgi:hypothetical protein